jgi:ligand-binding sensor domain-containing protein
MKHILPLLPLAINSIVLAQTTTWVNYTPQIEVRDIASNETSVWLATQGGLVHIDVLTGIRTWYNRSNSGVPANYVHAVALAENGDLWAATAGGLAHFDGSTWTAYRPDNAPLPDPVLYDVAVGPNGEVWMQCGNGSTLLKLDNGTWSIVDCGVIGTKSLAVASNGHLYMGTSSAGLMRYDGSSWVAFHTGNSNLPSNQVPRVNIAPSGLVYLRSGTELVSFDGNTFTPHPLPVSTEYSSNVEHIAVTDNGTCFVTTSAVYLAPPEMLWPRCLRLSNGVWLDIHHVGYPNPPLGPMGPIGAVNDFDIWTGSNRLASYTNFDWAQEEYESSAPGQVSIISLHATPDGEVWAGGAYATTANRYVFDGTAWSEFNSGQLITINDIITDAEEEPILATPNGVLWADGFDWTTFNTGNSPLPSNYIEQVFMDNDGALWVVPENGGILKYNGSWTTYTTANAPLSSNDVNSIAQHSDGTYWIGTGNGASGGGGVSRFDGTNWTTWTPANANLPFNIFVPDIAIASDGTPWFLLDRIGDLDLVARFDGTDFVLQDALNSTLPQNLYCLIIGPDDVPFVGTTFDGLKYRQPGENDWSTFNIANSGIADNSVLDLSRAPNDDLWIATGGGVNRLTLDFVESISDASGVGEGLLLAPNIVDDQLQLSLDMPAADKTSIEVTDAGGRLVHRADARLLPAGRSHLSIDTHGLAPGSYVLNLRGEVLRSARFVVQR